MTKKRNGFTLVELIVVLVILAILAAIMIPSMTGWIDKAKNARLITECRTCVEAAQTLAVEAYSIDKSTTPPESTAVMALADIDGTVSDITLDPATAAVDTLTYRKGEEVVTYMRLPSPHYVFGDAVSAALASVWEWAQSHQPSNPANEWLTIDYSAQNPAPLTPEQTASIFGTLVPASEPQYIYPMAIYDASGNLLNVQYVTPQDPFKSGSQNRYMASAFIIDGKTYISTFRSSGKVLATVNGKPGTANSFQRIMNYQTFSTTQEFVDLITQSGYFELAG